MQTSPTERQALDAAIKRAVSSAPFVRSISAALAGVLMTPDDGACVLPPVCQQSRKCRWSYWGWMGYEVRDDAGYELDAHKSSHEAFQGRWVIAERRMDGEGVTWTRQFPLMVVDDFGNLVEVQ